MRASLNEVRAALDHTAKQIEPDATNLERALGEPFERDAFALGMLCAAFVMTGLNAVELAAMYPEVFSEFREKCRNQPRPL